MRRVAVVLAIACHGCAFMASGLANHNSRGTACIDTPAFALIDIVIATAAAGGIVAADEGGYAWIAPGVFGASGIIGGVSAIACQERGKGSEHEAPPASNSAPTWDAEVDPEAREATREEWGTMEPEPAVVEEAPTIPMPTMPTLRVPRNYDIDKTQPEKTEDEPITCRDAPGSCPPGMTCAIAGGNAGTCVPDRTR